MEIGGFPEVARTGDATLLEQYWRDILYRDVIARYGIKNVKEIKELSLFLAAHPGSVQSYRNLGNLIGVRSVNTVKNYLNALTDVYLFQFIDLFDYSLKRQIYNPSKVYCADGALGNAVSFRFSRNIGHIYENMVFLALKRGRFFSCVLDERHLYVAVRYVEMNPVRGDMVAVPQDYRWSSARAHVTGAHDPILSARCFLNEAIADWARYLGTESDKEATESVIKATKNGRPCGDEGFVKQMEQSLNRTLTARPRGRPWKKE